jgi:hypothetical protein
VAALRRVGFRQSDEEIVQHILRIFDRNREPAGETKQRSAMQAVERCQGVR